MIKQVGMLILILSMIPTGVKSHENYDKETYSYGYTWGSFSTVCSLYRTKLLSEDNANLMFEVLKRRIKKDNMPSIYRNKLLSFGTDGSQKDCRKFMY